MSDLIEAISLHNRVVQAHALVHLGKAPDGTALIRSRRLRVVCRGYYRSASNLFWQYAQETKFGARLHDIRHKFAVERLQEGWSVYRVQRYLGHRSVTTTERYYFRYLTQEQAEVARADGNAGL